MQTSESLSKIAPALVAAQREITFAAKDAKNPQFKSQYADLGSVISACKPALNKHGIAFVQFFAPSNEGELAITTRLIHDSGEWIESTATCPLQKRDPQGFGSAATYMRRYSLAAAVGLYQDDDDGNAASGKPEPRGVIAAVVDQLPPLSAGDCEYYDSLAHDVTQTFNNLSPMKALERVMLDKLETEQRVHLESRLDSKVRSGLKKAADTLRAERKTP